MVAACAGPATYLPSPLTARLPPGGYAPVARNAESDPGAQLAGVHHPGSLGGWAYETAPAVSVVLTAGVLCEVVGSAVTYSPTPSRGQYHRRGRA